MIKANTRKRIHVISIEGSVFERYFAVTSDVPRNMVEARISAMPRNGRSARAGARFAGCFSSGEACSDNGDGALSSLMAVAGRVTSKTRNQSNWRAAKEA